MPRTDVSITMRDGVCPASVFTTASGVGPWPAVIFFMDGLGIRPVMWEMGQRLADGGYLVLLPDLYYRLGRIRRWSLRRCWPIRNGAKGL